MKWVLLGSANRAHFTIYGKRTLCGLDVPDAADAWPNPSDEWRCSTCARRSRGIEQGAEPPARGGL